MKRGIGNSVSLVACFAIAMHAILFGLPVLPAAGSGIDPLTVICHSDPAGAPASEQAPNGPRQTPSKACDHCGLCAVAAAAAAPDAIAVGQLAPAAVLHILTPDSQASRPRLATTQHPARGPPRLT